MLKKLLKTIIWVMILVGIFNVYKPLPAGVDLAGVVYQVPSNQLQFIADKTYVDEEGVRHSEQEIFSQLFNMINEAEHYILMDMFLFNDFLGSATTSYRGLSGELVQTLVDKKKTNPDIVIQVVTDPINELYGGYEAEQIKNLRLAGIPVIITDLTALRDSNPFYSAPWRTILQWVPFSWLGKVAPNILDKNKDDVTLEAYVNMLNFKANHRKLIVTDYKTINGNIGMKTLITSANPHDGSSAHTNNAVLIDGYIWRDVLKSEKAVADFSNEEFLLFTEAVEDKVSPEDKTLSVQLLTERSIKRELLKSLNQLQAGDGLDMAMFYFSDRDIIKAIKDADERGVQIRILLDPNKDAFGREKGGVPNRPVANELLVNSQGNINIRWCDTHGEQCHTKLLIFKNGENRTLLQGSANLTRRNLNNLNLETNVIVHGDASMTVFTDVEKFFEAMWNNEAGKYYSTDYKQYHDSSFLKKTQYRIGELTGLSSF